MNINDFDRLFRRTLSGFGVTGEAVYLRLGRVNAKTLRVLSHVTIENRTNSYTKVRLGIQAGNIYLYLDELESPAADELCVSRSDVILGEGDVFFSELTGTTDGDTLVMTCVGWTKKI